MRCPVFGLPDSHIIAICVIATEHGKDRYE